jgi:hypothetical protein
MNDFEDFTNIKFTDISLPLQNITFECESSEDEENDEHEEKNEGLVLKQLKRKSTDKNMTAEKLDVVNEDDEDEDDEDEDDEDEDEEEDDELMCEIEENIFSLQNLYFFVGRIVQHNFVGVYTAIDKNTLQKVCIKIVIKNDYVEKTPIEVKILSLIQNVSDENSTNLQKILKYFDSPTSYVIVTKFEKESSFRKTLFQKPDDIKNVMKQLLSAINVLHSNNIFSRDIKPSNLLYDSESKNLVLIDFDLATFENEKGHSCVLGTDGFIAPEILCIEKFKENRNNDFSKIKRYDKSIDIYSAGVVFGSLLYEVRENDMHDHVIKSWKKSMAKNKNKLSPAKNLLRKMLNNDYLLRPNVQECISHEYFL